MAIPDFQTLMLPVLRRLGDGHEHALGEPVAAISDEFGLTPEERAQPLPSGTQPIITNRVAWAKTFLQKAGLVEPVRRGVARISQRGIDVLAQKPSRIDMKFLQQFPEYVAFRAIRREKPEAADDDEDATTATPEEALEGAYQRLRAELETEVLDQVKRASPAFFERLVIRVLVAMGYGGTLSEAGKVIGGSGDEGIDGIIKEDRLGLDVIYVQAKRWENPVSRPEVQKFAGALQGQRARKGILLTTSTFTREAQEFALKIDSRVVLVDGPTLASLMVDHNVGVSPVRSFDLKRIDSDFFSEE
jgi:restriction system protein